MSETFRLARPDEVKEIASLVGHSFVGRPAGVLEDAIREGPLGGIDIGWVGEEAGRVTAACQLLRFHQWVGGQRLPIMGLALVAVSPAHRRRRVAGRLVSAGLRHARERGDLGTALYPFRIGFYEDLGYGLAGEAHEYLLPPASFRDAPERLGVRLIASDEDRATIRSLYDRWAPAQNGQLERHDGHWARLWQGEKAGVLFESEAGDAEGYAIVHYRSDLPPANRHLDVDECVWLTPAARRGLHAWLGSLGDQWRLIAYRAHPEDGFPSLVREPRLPPGDLPHWSLWFPSAVLMAGPMFRLLDVATAWRERRVSPEAAITLGLEVQDEQLPDNAGVYRLRLEEGRVQVERSGSAGVDVTLRLSVRVLSQLFVGSLTPSTAVYAEAAEVDRPELLPALDRALTLKRPWMFDRF